MKRTNITSWKKIAAGTMAFMLCVSPMLTGNENLIQNEISILASAKDATDSTMTIKDVLADIIYIKSIKIGTEEKTKDFGNDITIPANTAVVIQSYGRLEFNGVTANEQFSKTNEVYTYTFTTPAASAAITVTHVFDYELSNKVEEPNALYGIDNNYTQDSVQRRAILSADNVQYLDDLSVKLEKDKENPFALDVSTIVPTYEAKSAGVQLVSNKPVYPGEYLANASVKIGNVAITMKDGFKISPRSYKDHTNEFSIALQSADFTYNKQAQKPNIIVKNTNNKLAAANQTLKEGKDYELGYLNKEGKFVSFKTEGAEQKLEQTNAGTYTVYVNFIGNYTGTTSIQWSIKQEKLPAVKVTPDTNLKYNGTAHPVTVAAADGSALPEAASALFHVTYIKTADLAQFKMENLGKADYAAAPVNVGEYTAIVSVKDKNYKLAGNIAKVADYPQANFTVTPRAITVTPDAAKKTYGEKDPAFSCTTADEQAKSEKKNFNDYITRENGDNAGTYKFKVKDADKNGSRIVDNYQIKLDDSKNVFTINKKEIKPTVIVTDGTYTYNGSKYEPAIKVMDGNTVIDASEYTVTYSNNVNAGTATVTVKNKDSGNYVLADSSATFTIKPKSVKDLTITVPEETYVADGTTAFEPKVIVKDGETVLTADKDYTLAYRNNINAGTATVTLTGKGNYTDKETKSTNFKVLAKVDLSSVNDKLESITYDGKAIELNKTGIYSFETGKTIKITSKQSLALDVELTANDETLENYWYEFTIPAGKNLVSSTHKRNYKISIEGDIVYGTDKELVGAEKERIAQLAPDAIYYLDDIDQKVYVKVEEGAGITVSNVVYRYEVVEGGSLVDDKPVTAGTYKVTAETPINGTNYSLTKQITILPRGYAANTEEMKVTVNNASTVYNGKAVVPEIVVTDSKRAEAEQTLVRGKEYQIGYYEGEGEAKKFVPVTDDAAYFTKAEAGDYSVVVKFIGNYQGETEAKWSITPIVLPALTITPDSELAFNNAAHPVTVAATDAETTADTKMFKVVYGNAESTPDSEKLTDTAPTAAGSYKAFIKLVDAKNTAFAEGQVAELAFTISRKSITSSDVTIEPLAATTLKKEGWTECGEITITDAATGQKLVKDKDFSVERNKTNVAGKNLKILINGEGNYVGGTYVDWTVIDYDVAKINQEEAKNVEDQIAALSTVKYDESYKESLENAKAAYEALNDDQKALVATLADLKKAEAAYAAIDAVVTQIDEIGDVSLTPESKARIDSARAAYDAMTDEAQKKQVLNYRILTYAENLYQTLETTDKVTKDTEAEKSKAVADKEAAEAAQAAAEQAAKEAETAQRAAEEKQAAAEKAKQESDVAAKTANEKAAAAVEAQKAAEDALTKGEKDAAEKVAAAESAKKAAEDAQAAAEQAAKETSEKAAAAEAAQKAAEEAVKEAEKAESSANQAAADKVIDKIKLIGTVAVTNQCENAIVSARAAYDMLTEDQKALVTNYAELTNAEKTYQTISKYYAPVDKLCKMAVNDYAQKTNTIAAKSDAETNDDGTLSILLKDEDGKVLNTYTIDPVTATGSDAEKQEVNLPQTGVTSKSTAAAVGGAFAMIAAGFWTVIRSFRRKKDEE